MPGRLELTKNAQFYKSKQIISSTHIDAILNAAIDNMEAGSDFVINLIRTDAALESDNTKYKYSVRVFPTARPVYFINEVIKDRIYAFIIIIEYDNHIVVFKKSCANITDAINKNFDLIGSLSLSSTFDDNDVEFQKIALRNMTVSDRAMRARSYEAADLKGLLSKHSAGRSIPYYYKFRQGPTIKTISSTGRLVESSQRKTLDEIATWAKEQIELIKKPSQNKSFLGSFARMVELPDVLGSCDPNALLIESTPLYEHISRDNLTLKYKTSKDKLITPSSRIINKLLHELEKVHELNSKCEVIGHENNSKLRTNKKTLTINSKSLKKFLINENGKEITLQNFIINNGYYSVTFTDPKYMYFMGSCFEDSSGISEIDSILEILQPITKIGSVKSEKGKLTNSSTNFDNDSMFGVVEDIHKKDDYIFCDDLGIEWADHITFNKSDSNICFIHSKHGDPSTSASNLHDVVGQGIKNLGNMRFSKDQLINHISNKTKNKYRNNRAATNIDRIRKGNISNINSYLDSLLKDYRLHRKCILSCSFLSKQSVASEFNKIKSGNRVSGHVIQLLWIISSFAHAVKDMSAIPIIYCND